ncbi:CotH kinase family protein [Dysgonomonas sp. GY617]|uniref:CotH kinase family protein n=1 Tax=Dysgonomonas sp. GY617 TaxID=2780420 RepID=UPI001883FD4C|nr:CotH kinase family protein [Dysgonomonas sp. GY617]MBF0577610.1 CotH kinase family protein [Dysgonomonas sp. GY617]
MKKDALRNAELEKIFDLESLPVVTLEIKVADWNRLLDAFDEAPGDNYWIPGDFVFGGNPQIPSQTVSNVALRVRGNSSRNRPEGEKGEHHNPVNPVWRQASFALQFARNVPGQTFEGLSRLDLKFIREDPARIREVYSFDLYQEAGVYSGPLISMCRFYVSIIDGISTPAYFGLYKLKEFIEDDYLENRKAFFGDDQPGDFTPFLWKGDNDSALNNYDPSVIEDRTVYDLRTNTNKRAEANAQLTSFVRNLVTLEGEALKVWANKTIDVRLLMKSYLINVICGNVDDYWSNANNYNFYFNTHGKFFFIPNDFDTTLGTAWAKDAARQDPLNWGNFDHPLIQRLLTIAEFKHMYINAFHELTNSTDGPFHVSKSIPRIEKWYALIKDYLWDETIHFGCDNDDAGCVLQPQETNYQTPFEDTPAWWTSGGENSTYRLLERGENNFFEVSGDPARMPQIHD